MLRARSLVVVGSLSPGTELLSYYFVETVGVLRWTDKMKLLTLSVVVKIGECDILGCVCCFLFVRCSRGVVIHAGFPTSLSLLT